ncbi:GNAT family N-acetyltransferase [bacterium]|nr:GNAT family N-acetyltransferase [bacterium]
MRLDLGDYCVRPFTADDAAAIARYANNRAVWITLRDRFPHPYTLADAAAFLAAATAQQPAADFAIASQREAIGGIGLQRQSDVHRLSAEIGYWLGEPYWGRGIATRAVRAVTEWAFATSALERVFACVFATNPASARVLTNAGYQFEGRLRRAVVKDGRILDQLVYAALRP